MSASNPEMEEGVATESREEVTEPPLYKVLLHNDNYTTMEFVVEILMLIFKKAPEEAARIMLNVHHNGIGVCGVYTFEVAETKVDTVHALPAKMDFRSSAAWRKNDDQQRTECNIRICRTRRQDAVATNMWALNTFCLPYCTTPRASTSSRTAAATSKT